MNSVLSVIVTVMCFAVLAFLYWLWAFRPVRPKENPSSQKPTMFDVRRLLKEGKKEDAVGVYAKLFKVSAKQARKDVEELERSLEV